MPAQPPRFVNPLSAGSPQRRADAPAAPSAQPLAALSSIEADLAATRGEYAARRYDSVKERLDEIDKRIASAAAAETLTPELESAYAAVEASLNTLRGRLLAHRDHAASQAAFQRAVSLFEKYRDSVERHRGRMRLYTDWGIALHRLGRVEESIAKLTEVCASGVAPAEAFGYLGYGELAEKRLEVAERELRNGLAITPADSTMNFYLGRVLGAIARQAAPEDLAKAAEKTKAAVEAYNRAGEIARGVQDYSLAGRCGLWALRLEPADLHAMRIATDCYRRLGRSRLALRIVTRFLDEPGREPAAIALAIKGILLRDCGNAKASVEALRSVPADSPEFAWVRAELAQSVRAADPKDAGEALRIAQEAAVLGPEEPFVQRVVADLAIDSGDYPEAADSLRRLRALDPSADVALELGGVLYYCGQYAEAIEELKQALAANSRSADAHFFLGLSAQGLKDLDRALTEFRKAAYLDPKNRDYFAAIMSALSTSELRAQALDEIEDRLDGPLGHLALWYKGRFEIADEQWEAALKTLTAAGDAATAIQADNDLVGILVDCGDVLREMGRYEDARQSYERALALSPGRPDVLFGLALWRCDLAAYDQALELLGQALSSEPIEDDTAASCWDLRGWCLQHQGKLDAAIDAYGKAVHLNKDRNPWYLKGLANAMMGRDKKKAKELFGRILDTLKYRSGPEPVTERPSGNASTVGLLGWSNYRLECYDEAIRLFQIALAGPRENPALRFDLGLAFLASKRAELAVETYQRAHDAVERGEAPRRRGLYYVALFDLADARRLKVVGEESDRIFEMVREWSRSSGVQLETLSWLSGTSAV